jgi:hypothetical protein
LAHGPEEKHGFRGRRVGFIDTVPCLKDAADRLPHLPPNL